MGKIAFLFPGQGSQSPGMAQSLVETFSAAKNIFARADRILGRSISKLCREGSAEELLCTTNTQPALYVSSAAALAVLFEETSVRPGAVAGHSVGEYAALLAADVLEFESGLHLVSERAKFMQDAAAVTPGAMAAVLGLNAEAVREICERVESSDLGIVEPANYNSPGQVIISGTAEGVSAASGFARESGAMRVLPLKVSGAFHSRLMASAAEAMMEVLRETSFLGPTIPVISNVTAAPMNSANEMRELLSAQIDHPVRWEESLQRLNSDGFSRFVEVGNGNVLSGLVKRTLPQARCVTFGCPQDLDGVLELGVDV